MTETPKPQNPKTPEVDKRNERIIVINKAKDHPKMIFKKSKMSEEFDKSEESSKIHPNHLEYDLTALTQDSRTMKQVRLKF